MITQRAFILRVFKYGESDLVVHALGQNGQKLKLFARAAMKSRKRFGGGVLEPTHYVSLSYREGAEDSLGQLHEASLVESFQDLRRDYDRLNIALHFVSLIDRLTLEGLTDSKPLFDLLGNGLIALQTATRMEALKTQFELKLLYHQGVLPHVDDAELLLSGSIREGIPEGVSPEMAQKLEHQAELLLARYLQR